MPPEPKKFDVTTAVEGNLLKVKIFGSDAEQIYSSLMALGQSLRCNHPGLEDYVERNHCRVVCTKSKVNTYSCDLTYSLKNGQLQPQQKPCPS